MQTFQLKNLLTGKLIKSPVKLTMREAAIFNYAFALNNVKQKYFIVI